MANMEFFAYIILASYSLYLAWTTQDSSTKIAASTFSIVFWVVCAIQHTYDYSADLGGLVWAYLLPVSLDVFLMYDGASDYFEEGFYKGDNYKEGGYKN